MKRHAILMGLMATALMSGHGDAPVMTIKNEDYNHIIEEYRLILQKKSRLSSNQRTNIVNMVKVLIKQGKIKEAEL